MKALLVQNIWREYFGFMMLSAVLKRDGHEVVNLVDHRVTRLLEAIERERPGMVAFSFTNCEQGWVEQAASAVKQNHPELPVVIGGPHPTLHPELALKPQFDMVCRGEGEGPMLDLAAMIDNGDRDWSKIENMCFSSEGELVQNSVRPLIEDLDSLPLHDRDSYYRYRFLRNNPVKYFFTGRGCPFNCSFCFNRRFKEIYPNSKSYIRHYSVERVIEEIAEVKRRWPMKQVRFEDDVFTLQRKWLLEFLDLYEQQIRVPYLAYIRAGESEEVIRRLSQTGCFCVLFGVETGDEQRRNELLNKAVKDEQIRQTAALLHKYKIHFFTSNILGLPGETFDLALKTVRINQQIKAPDVWCSVFQPYAGLEITDYAIECGYLQKLDDDTVGINTFADNALDQPDQRRIFNLQKFFYPLVRWPWLEPLLLPLTKLRPNFVFHYIFVLFYTISYLQHSKVGLIRMFFEGLHWFRVFLADSKTK
ncbi:MAG: radical SAM protein [Candidatus Alcyoniella australis]|nr:radical SAM protein [Candidatus Alcyoniella australis]